MEGFSFWKRTKTVVHFFFLFFTTTRPSLPKEGTYPLQTSPQHWGRLNWLRQHMPPPSKFWYGSRSLCPFGVSHGCLKLTMFAYLPINRNWLRSPPPWWGWGGKKTFRTNGSLEPGWGLGDTAEMLSERSEFISAFQEPARRPMSSGRFWLLLWFGFFFATEEEMNIFEERNIQKGCFLKNNCLYVIGNWFFFRNFAPAFAM